MVLTTNTVFGTELWSQPTYTEVWSQPTYTEVWSEPTYTETWSEPTYTDIWTDPVEPIPWDIPDLTPAWEEEASKPSTYVKLQIGNKTALVQDKNIELDVPPITINGRTMVPVRFLGEEALKARVDWDNYAQKATLTLEDKKVELVVGKSVGLVNGKEIPLDVPVTKIDGRVLVPLRFVSENLGLYVNYIDATKTIEISDKAFTVADASTSNENIGVADDTDFEPITDFEKLYGTWYIWTASSATNLYYKDTGNYATHELNMGADQGKIVINKDGTYTMTHSAWGTEQVEGKWRLSYPREINGEPIMAIVLLNGITNSDWAVAPSTTGKIRLLSAYRWADGSATWIIDSELYRK